MVKNPDIPVSIPARPLIKHAAKFGMTVIAAFFGGLLIWSLAAPLEKAAIAPGKITVDSNRKSIQHLEGGIVGKIHIRDGSQVKKDDLLITLSNTRETAQLGLYQARPYELLAAEARLKAERDDLKEIAFPKSLRESKDESAQSIMESNRKILKANRKNVASQVKILKQRIEQLKKEISSLQAQAKSKAEQLKLIQEEIKAVAFLEKKKLIERPRLLALQREAARLKGDRDEQLGLIARAEQRIGETQVQIISVQEKYQKDTLDVLRQTQQQLTDVVQQMKAATDVFVRTEIRSPIDGKVVGLKHHTIGGVVKPGEVLLQIVPSEDRLVVEARVSPLDIDIVTEGLTASVSLTAFKQRSTPNLNGKVIHVSADSFQDPNTQQTYYLARVEIDRAELKRLPDNVQLKPGMPAQVLIVVGRQTLIGYLISPIRDSFYRAFRES